MLRTPAFAFVVLIENAVSAQSTTVIYNFVGTILMRCVEFLSGNSKRPDGECRAGCVVNRALYSRAAS